MAIAQTFRQGPAPSGLAGVVRAHSMYKYITQAEIATFATDDVLFEAEFPHGTIIHGVVGWSRASTEAYDAAYVANGNAHPTDYDFDSPFMAGLEGGAIVTGAGTNIQLDIGTEKDSVHFWDNLEMGGKGWQYYGDPFVMGLHATSPLEGATHIYRDHYEIDTADGNSDKFQVKVSNYATPTWGSGWQSGGYAPFGFIVFYSNP